jgi:hypothetical protein
MRDADRHVHLFVHQIGAAEPETKTR